MPISFNLDQFTRVNPFTVVLNIIVAFLLGLLIAWVYKKTHRGLSYSKSFVFTLVMLAVLVTTVMMVIGGSLTAAFTLLGSFAIIRFRTAIKDTRDVAYIFWSLVTGLAVGTSNYLVAVISALLILGIIWFFVKTNFGSIRNYNHVLSFTLDTSRAPNDAHKSVFDKYLKNQALLNVQSRESGNKLEFTFNVAFLDENQIGNFVSELRGAPGVEGVNLLTAKEDIEY